MEMDNYAEKREISEGPNQDGTKAVEALARAFGIERRLGESDLDLYERVTRAFNGFTDPKETEILKSDCYLLWEEYRVHPDKDRLVGVYLDLELAQKAAKQLKRYRTFIEGVNFADRQLSTLRATDDEE